MAARASLQPLVDRLRSMTGAATDDEFGGIVYWTDDQLQIELDNQRQDVRLPLVAIPQLIDGSTRHQLYHFVIPRGWAAEPLATVRDKVGAALDPSSYTVSLHSGYGAVHFVTDVGLVPLTVEVALFDLNAAAASVWEQKAAHRSDYITIKLGDTRFDAAQERDFCASRAAWFRARRVKSFSPPKAGFVPASRTRGRR